MLLAIIALCGYVAFLSIRINDLSRNLEKLEGLLKNNRAVTSQRALPDMTRSEFFAPKAISQEVQVPVVNVAEESFIGNSGAKPVTPHSEDNSSAFVDWLKEDWLVKLGAFFLLMSFGWFVSHAFANNWIGPVGRITLGLLAGALVMLLGVWRIKKFQHQGSIFTVVGATIILLTLFAARAMYGLFTPISALGLMFLTVSLVALISYLYKREALATASLVLGAIAPMLTNSPMSDIFGLFLYLTLLVLGTLWVVAFTGWSRLILWALATVFTYSALYVAGSLTGVEKDVMLLFSFIFTTIFLSANVISIIKRTSIEHQTVQLVTGVVTGLYITFMIWLAADEEWQSLLLASWSMVFAIGSFVVYHLTNNQRAFYLYASVGLSLLGIATAVELSGPALTIAYIIEIGLLIFLATILKASSTTLARLSSLFILPALLSLENFASPNWRSSVLHEDFAILSLLALIFLIMGGVLLRRAKQDNNEDIGTLATTFYVGSGFYMMALTWLVTHASMPDDTATTFSLILYTVSGIILFISGRAKDSKALVYGGGFLIAVVVARLLLIDVWQMALSGRIITFFSIGVLLMSTAFIRRSKNANPQ